MTLVKTQEVGSLTFSRVITTQRSLGMWPAWLLACINVLLQIAYPLASDPVQRTLTILSVCAFFLASFTHALISRGMRCAAALVGVCVGGGLVVEAIGWRSGFPFGNYRYGSTLGAKVLGVPLVVPLAWAMMGWPAFVAGRFAVRRFVGARQLGWARILGALIGAALLTTWDLFLDPQMVDAGHWRWLPTAGPALNGIPVVNSLGWFGVATLMMLTLHWLIDRDPLEGRRTSDDSVQRTSAERSGIDLVLWVLLGWTWFSEWFGHLVFFGRPWVSLTGGLAMGVVLFGVVRLGRANNDSTWNVNQIRQAVQR
jgi:uncharacterized membrane protein